MDEKEYSGTLTKDGDLVADFWLCLDSTPKYSLHMTDALEAEATRLVGSPVTVLGILDSGAAIIDVSAVWPTKPKDMESGG